MARLRTACDLHLHSCASVGSEWYSVSFGCPESYATPQQQYALCKARGMSLVTLTDHDTIDGALQLIDRPDFFISEEVSTVFPEDGCALHVLAWNITPAQHERLQCARASVYDLVDVLRRERIAHACAHPLLSPNWKLTPAALEKILVLFPVLEGINGLAARGLDGDLRTALAGVDANTIAELARRHGLSPAGRRTAFVAGSDAHAARYSASCFTTADGIRTPCEFLEAVTSGDTRCHGHNADLNVMYLTASHVTHGFLGTRKQERPDYRDPFVDLVEVVAGRERGTDAPTGLRDELVRSMLAGASRTGAPLGPDAAIDDLTELGDAADARIVARIRDLHDGLVGRAFDELVEGVGDLDMYRVLGGLRDLAGAASAVVPFVLAADHFGRQRRQSANVVAAWSGRAPTPRLAIFSDSLVQVDGVTTSLRQFVRRAQAEGREVRIPYCGERPLDATDGVHLPLPRATCHSTPVYSGMQLHLPSLLGTIDWLWRNEITHVDLATPGPMGIFGLLAARLLRLPVTASYHTEIPELLRQLSASPLLHAGARRLAGWFYSVVDRVFAFSELSRRRLMQLGVPAARVEYVPVAIDPHEFSPAHACSNVYPSVGVCAADAQIILTVGRLSREKNIPLIIEAVGRLQTLPRPPVLVVVGDGPERGRLVTECADKPYVVFVGLQQGDVLKRLYATATAFVFASQIDTLGLAAMEAMSSGVPVIVPSGTAIAELVEHRSSGAWYEFGIEGLVQELTELLSSPASRATMSANARQAMIDRWNHSQFSDLWRAMAGG